MSVIELLEAGNFDARTAALCWMVLEAHGSLLISAEEPHSGKTTTLTAFLDFIPPGIRGIFIRGWSETFDYLEQTDPARTLLLANELSSHLPVYLWGPKAVRVFQTLQQGYALASTLHADSAREAVTQLTDELGVAEADLAKVDLLAVMRIFETSRGEAVRRVVSLHRVRGLVPLVEWDQDADEHRHHEDAQLDLLLDRRGRALLDRAAAAPGVGAAVSERSERRSDETPSSRDRGTKELRADLARRTAFLESLVERGISRIPAVHRAFAAFREADAPGRPRAEAAS